MAFSVPDFNLTCNIYTGPWDVGLLRVVSPCNLRMGRGGIQAISSDAGSFLSYGNQPQLLLPAGTDIRDVSCSLVFDNVEVPAGSGRFYCVMLVDDVGKGFPNEFRCATIGKVFQGVLGSGSYPGLFWPAPIP